MSLTYTPFDLPKTITDGAGMVTLGYDGDEQRIRKSTPKEEKLYFGGLYERVTKMAPTITEHRYYVHSPERVVAIVTRGGKQPGTLYVHADHLGSVESLTAANGAVMEKRSYDAFGQRRNPVWGEAPPASFTSKTTLGFTGHESDGELGLVNMKGRVYDPKLGRFLTTDPIISDLSFGQSFNPYSYVLNSPLTFVDPSGFAGEPIYPIRTTVTTGPGGVINVLIEYPPRGTKPPAPRPDPPPQEAAQVGAAAPTTDVDTTGSSPEPTPATVIPEDWRQHPTVQVEAGFFGGLLLGLVPFAGVGRDLLDAAGVLPTGTPEMMRGLAVGQIVGGIFTLVGGVTGEVLGGAASVTGIGAAVGVPAIAISTTLVVGGAGNILSGLQALTQATSSGSGSGSGPPQAAPPAGSGVRPSTLQPGPHAGGSVPARGPQRNFTPGERAKINEIGQEKGCHTCGTTTAGTKSGNFVPDHQPPNKVNPPGGPQNLYPHCKSCSNSQGGTLSHK